ncbi:MAG: hypothetical protein NC910_02255 [Candidatus Omnitrophica bacterium]|nr:hypothetical protein [Candidatus Omnitrophota bacterium]
MKPSFPISPVQEQVLRFFRRHDHAVESIRSIAGWLGLEGKVVEQAVKGLVDLKWLSAHEVGSATAYSLPSDRQVLADIEEFLTA